MKSTKIRLIAATAAAAISCTLATVAMAAPAKALPVPSYELRNLNTGKCVDDSLDANLNSRLRHVACNGLNFQKWNFYPQVVGNTTYYVLQNQNTGHCLDDSEFGLRSIQCFYNVYQQWTQEPFPHPAGSVFIYHNRVTGRCLDDSASFNLRTVQCNAQTYQMFRRT